MPYKYTLKTWHNSAFEDPCSACHCDNCNLQFRSGEIKTNKIEELGKLDERIKDFHSEAIRINNRIIDLEGLKRKITSL